MAEKEMTRAGPSAGGATEEQVLARMRTAATLIGPQQPLTQSFLVTLNGDYVAAGVGMRNLGSGQIAIDLPPYSSIVRALLYWSIIRQAAAGPAPAGGWLNGQAITGTLIATTGSPGWPDLAEAEAGTTLADVFRADVSEIAVAGSNFLTEFPSGLTDGTPPQDAPRAFPLLNGASLVVIFSNPGFPLKTVIVNDGGQTVFGNTVSTTLQNFVATSPVQAKTTYIVSDGQARFLSDSALFEATAVAGPGTGLKTADAFDGQDGLVFFPLDGLWDTLTVDVSGFINPGDTSAVAAITAGAGGGSDWLTYVAQVFSVTAAEILRVRGYRIPGMVPLGPRAS
ncbi:MAG: hypothetical protein AB1446_01330 [Bacillota bacterium]